MENLLPNDPKRYIKLCQGFVAQNLADVGWKTYLEARTKEAHLVLFGVVTWHFLMFRIFCEYGTKRKSHTLGTCLRICIKRKWHLGAFDFKDSMSCLVLTISITLLEALGDFGEKSRTHYVASQYASLSLSGSTWKYIGVDEHCNPLSHSFYPFVV